MDHLYGQLISTLSINHINHIFGQSGGYWQQAELRTEMVQAVNLILTPTKQNTLAKKNSALYIPALNTLNIVTA